MKCEIKKYRKNMGHEGEGFYCQLWVDGKLAAHVTDSGNGGSPLYLWVDKKAREEVHAHIATLPPKQCFCKGMEPWSQKADAETFIVDLIARHKLKKTCKTKTVFRLKGQEDGDYYEMKAIYSPQIAQEIRQKYGDTLLEIINETL